MLARRTGVCLALIVAAASLAPSNAFGLSGKLSINRGAAYTRSRVVTASNSVSGARKMCFSTGGRYSRWVSFARTKKLTLPARDGVQRVKARYKSASGKTILRSDTIILDTVSPKGTFILEEDASYAIRQSVTGDVAVTGASKMRFKIDADDWGDWIAHANGPRTFFLATEGPHTVVAEFRDAAGNSLLRSGSLAVILARTHLSGPIDRDTRLSPGTVYVLDGNVTVAAGIRLVIPPRVCLITDSQTSGLTVLGSVEASGTRRNPTMLTPSAGVIGEGIVFAQGASGRLDDVQFRRQRSALAVGSAVVTVRYCRFAGNAQGVSVGADAEVAFSHNHFAGNTTFGLCFAGLRAARGLDASGTYTDNGASNMILVEPGEVTRDAVLPRAVVPYRLLSGAVIRNATLTVSAGVTITVDSGSLDVGDGVCPGRLVVLGTAQTECLFTSSEDATGVGGPGAWDGICILKGSSATLKYARVRHAWAGVLVSNDGGAPVEVSDCSLVENRYGLYVDLRPSASTAPKVDRTTVARNTEFGLFYEELGSFQRTTNTQTYTGNAHGNCIAFGGATSVEGTVTLFEPQGPSKVTYLMRGPVVVTPGRLVLTPGCLIKTTFPIATGVAGTIRSLGSASDHVVLTSAFDDSTGGHNADRLVAPTAGQWHGVVFEQRSSGEVRFTDIRYAEKALTIGNDEAPPVEVTDSNLSRNHFGIYVRLIPTPSTAPFLARNTVVSNDRYGFFFEELVSYRRATNTETYLENGHANCIAFAGADPMNGDVELFDPVSPSKIAYVLLGAKQEIQGCALTLGPGAVLKTDQIIKVQGGTLAANGTTESPVRITTLSDATIGGQNTDDPGPAQVNDWFGILAEDGARIVLRHVPLRHAAVPITAKDSFVSLQFVTMRDFSAALKGGNATVEMTNTQLHDGGTCLAVGGGSVRIADSQFNAVSCGVDAEGTSISLARSRIGGVSGTAVRAAGGSVKADGSTISSRETGLVGSAGCSIEMTGTSVESSSTCVSLLGTSAGGLVSFDSTGCVFEHGQVGLDMQTSPVTIRVWRGTFRELSEVGVKTTDYCGVYGLECVPDLGDAAFSDNTMDVRGPSGGCFGPDCHTPVEEPVISVQAQNTNASLAKVSGLVRLLF